MPNHETFTVSQVGIWIKDDKVLILEDAANPGVWLIPGGRIDEQEESGVAFARELKEEIGLEGFEVQELVDARTWFHGKDRDPKCSIARLIKSDQEEITISDEHLQYKWISEEELDSYEFVWPHAKEILKKGFEKS